MSEILPCKTCKKDPIFPVMPEFKQSTKGMYLEYKVESRCDCPVTINHSFKLFFEDNNQWRMPIPEDIKPLIDVWNKLNKIDEPDKNE